MIKVIRETESRWMVWNKKTGEVADIVAIQDFGYLASKRKQYRVDYKGKTVESMIGHINTAKAVAKRLVK